MANCIKNLEVSSTFRNSASHVPPISVILENAVTIGSKALFILSTTGMKPLNILLNASYTGSANLAPILPKAALIFDIAPWKVLFASFACSPNASSIASANCLKLIWPLLTILFTSSSVVCKAFASTADALRPLAASCLSCMVINFPFDDTVVKTSAISVYDEFVIAATPEIALRFTFISSLICLVYPLDKSIEATI